MEEFKSLESPPHASTETGTTLKAGIQALDPGGNDRSIGHLSLCDIRTMILRNPLFSIPPMVILWPYLVRQKAIFQP